MTARLSGSCVGVSDVTARTGVVTVYPSDGPWGAPGVDVTAVELRIGHTMVSVSVLTPEAARKLAVDLVRCADAADAADAVNAADADERGEQ